MQLERSIHFLVLLTGQDLNFEELQVFSNCTNCPANAVSLPGSASPAACGCLADSYEEMQVLNPQYAQRKYSSIHGNNLYGFMLDDLSNSVSWSASTNSAGQRMEIDAGEPIHIVVGIISQGRGVDIAQWTWINSDLMML